MSSDLDLYYFPTSPPVRSVLLLARFIGITFNLKMVNIFKGEQMQPDFLKLNPLHTVPTLDDNGFVLYESRSIMRYLVEQYDQNSTLVPKTPKKTAQMDQRMYYDAIVLFPKLVDYFLPVLFDKQPRSETALQKYLEALATFDQLQGEKKFIIGDTLTIADFSYFTTVSTAEAVLVNMDAYSNVTRWYNNMKVVLENHGLEELNTKPCEAVTSSWKKMTGQ